MLLVAASLLLIAGVDWICAAGLGCHRVSRLRGFLIVSTAAAACSVVLILYPGATIRMLCYVLTVYAVSLSVGKITLARSWKGTAAGADSHVYPGRNRLCVLRALCSWSRATTTGSLWR